MLLFGIISRITIQSEVCRKSDHEKDSDNITLVNFVFIKIHSLIVAGLTDGIFVFHLFEICKPRGSQSLIRESLKLMGTLILSNFIILFQHIAELICIKPRQSSHV